MHLGSLPYHWAIVLIVHQVWPSIWTKGNAWPDNGEIDIIEGVNHNPSNQMSLHTFAGCSAATNTTAFNQPSVTNCNNTGNTGCTVVSAWMCLTYGRIKT